MHKQKTLSNQSNRIMENSLINFQEKVNDNLSETNHLVHRLTFRVIVITEYEASQIIDKDEVWITGFTIFIKLLASIKTIFIYSNVVCEHVEISCLWQFSLNVFSCLISLGHA